MRDSTGQIVGVLTVAAETTHVTEQLQSLSEVAAALAGTLTLDDVARVALRYAISTFDPDQASFAVDEGGGGWRMVRRVRGELLDEADERLPRSGGARRRTGRPRGTGGALRRPVVHPRRATAAGHRRGPPRPEDPGDGGPAPGHLGGPWRVGGRLPGPHTWSPAERALLAASAELIGQAAERARRFETQHGTAQLLQRSMLPEHLPDLPRLRIAARYDPGWTATRPAATSTTRPAAQRHVGRGAGRCRGHDVQAAARMGQVRPRCARWPWPTRRPPRCWPAWTGW
ncbi:GAF domain-containing protein [Micromonospora sp. M12]